MHAVKPYTDSSPVSSDTQQVPLVHSRLVFGFHQIVGREPQTFPARLFAQDQLVAVERDLVTAQIVAFPSPALLDAIPARIANA